MKNPRKEKTTTIIPNTPIWLTLGFPTLLTDGILAKLIEFVKKIRTILTKQKFMKANIGKICRYEWQISLKKVGLGALKAHSFGR